MIQAAINLNTSEPKVTHSVPDSRHGTKDWLHQWLGVKASETTLSRADSEWNVCLLFLVGKLWNLSEHNWWLCLRKIIVGLWIFFQKFFSYSIFIYSIDIPSFELIVLSDQLAYHSFKCLLLLKATKFGFMLISQTLLSGSLPKVKVHTPLAHPMFFVFGNRGVKV